MRTFIITWVENGEQGQAVVKKPHIINAIDKVKTIKGLDDHNIVSAEEVNTDIIIIRDTGINHVP